MLRTWIGEFSPVLWICLAIFLMDWLLSPPYIRDGAIREHRAPAAAEWIQSEDSTQYTGCFRKEIELGTEVRSAWLSVVSEGGFELLCNGDPVGAQTYWRPTRAFQNGLTESGQRLLNHEPIVAYNFPREYQWSSHNNGKVLTVFDLRPYLRKGKNALCVEIESRLRNPSVIAFGQIELRSGERIQLATDATWQAEPVPRGLKQGLWMQPTADTRHWKQAVVAEKSRRRFVSAVPELMYRQPFQSRWVMADEGVASSDHQFTTRVQLDSPEHGWLRMLSHGDYWMWINGERVKVNRSKAKGYNGGDWLVKWEGRRPLAVPPVLLDPDETTSYFGGNRFQNPRHGDPTVNDFKRYENKANRTNERPNSTGENSVGDEKGERGRLQDPYGFYEETNTAVPQSLVRKRSPAQYHGYDVGKLLRHGWNEITVRLVVRDRLGYHGSQPMKFAIDGVVHEAGGRDVSLADLTWEKGDGRSENAQLGRAVLPTDLPALKYMGGSAPAPSPWWLWVVVIAVVALMLVNRHRIAVLHKPAVFISLSLLVVCVFQMSFVERSEMMWLMTPAWRFTIGAILLLISFCSFSRRWTVPQLGRGHWLCLALLCLVFLTRSWMVHEQPIDDDEYASIQAVLAIAETGKPSIAGDIWYSRSPLYHYAAAAVVKVFGPHIWALRLYSVVLSVLTGWLLWLLALRYFKDRWVAGAALLVFALHPFLIFSGHIARFYQQQQLMVLLMLHLFIQGFIYRKSIWHRAGAILVFAFAVLSQEISISFVPVFFLVYLLFGRGVPMKWEVKTVVYIVFAVVLVAADVLLFKIKCITRSVGVSPNVEATLAPTFWELGNLFSMFIGYARLHLVLSVFYVMSLVYSIRRGSSRLITLHVMLIISVVAFNLIITSVSFRYMYSIIPLWILLGVHGIGVFSHWTASQVGRNGGLVIKWLAFAAVVLSFSPWRIVKSYQEKLLGDPISALAYVRKEMRSEDKIMITEPHPHAAKIELGKVDYDLVVPILYDFTYNDGGVLRDRNGNAQVVNRLAALQQVFAEQPRVWVILNREKFRSRKKNIRWEYPGAREELFIRQNCELRYRSYLWAVYLWGRSAGSMDTFRKEPGSWVE
ncbi:glycosyltransferase family 39 protein [Verrucomicrobiaceae bacterium R5-34]|nr:glycosyltransferase family 39 protein [Verrucomicrobiaceae bacterium R5-34]